MSTSIEYSFVQENKEESLKFRNKVVSYGSEFVTNKNLTSFYMNFSKNSYFDSGLLPVDGSGLLSIRSAGPHTQIGYQHKPGMYYINWGGYENDPNAQKIYVAQPYRIVIADIYNDNILGARTFYSPIPITYPDAPLYHVNLPNINCKGYRGNGVGWICLYHKEDISHYPFNEKVAKVLDRCSGTEAYNDANMSETDGPRIYREHGKPSYLYIPSEWENYSNNHGVEWTLDPKVWIPVLVTDIDNQGEHDPEGILLTYGMALTGNYQAYYTDPIKPKFVNMIGRQDLHLSEEQIFNWFKVAYNSSTETAPQQNDTFLTSKEVRHSQSTAAPVFVAPEDENDENVFLCVNCDELHIVDEVSYHENYNGLVCEFCYESDNMRFVEHINSYVWHEHEDLCYNEISEKYYLSTHWHQMVSCTECCQEYIYDEESLVSREMLNIYNSKKVNIGNDDDPFEPSPILSCAFCLEFEEKVLCAACKNHYVPKLDSDYYVKTKKFEHDNYEHEHPVCNQCYHTTHMYYKFKDIPENVVSGTAINEKDLTITEDSIRSCFCGNHIPVKDFVKALNCFTTSIPTTDSQPLLDALSYMSLYENINSNDFIANISQFTLAKSNSIKNNTNWTLDGVPNEWIVMTSHYCPFCAMEISESKDELKYKTYVDTVQEKYFKIIQLAHSTDDKSMMKNIYGTCIQWYPWNLF